MRKKCFSLMAVLILTLSVCMTAFAEGESNTVPPIQEHGGTAAELKSYGKIVYQKGTDTIKIDSDDLYMLADQIDQVKLDVTDQLEALNTYFSTGEGIVLSTSEDINVVHATPAEEEAVDPLDVNFDTLLEGIAVSQSVSSDVTAYGYPAGTELYKNASGVLTTNGSEKGAEQISVAAATADNLSAGTAAWVNGSLILGTGEDNKSYREDGYKKGQEDGYKEGYKNGQSNVKCQFVHIGIGSKTVRFEGGFTHGYIIQTHTMRDGGGPSLTTSGNVKFTNYLGGDRNDSRINGKGYLSLTRYEEFTITDTNEVTFSFTNTLYPDDTISSMTAFIVLDR